MHYAYKHMSDVFLGAHMVQTIALVSLNTEL